MAERGERNESPTTYKLESLLILWTSFRREKPDFITLSFSSPPFLPITCSVQFSV